LDVALGIGCANWKMFKEKWIAFWVLGFGVVMFMFVLGGFSFL
jgi:hypothetical protein